MNQHVLLKKPWLPCERFFIITSGFTVLKDSVIAKDVTPSFNWRTKREQLIQEYVSTKNNQFVLNADVTFSSPSTAAAFCLGRSTNGWTTWKDIDNHTLDSIYRAQLE